MCKQLQREHGVVCRLAGERFGYFGWPTVARLDDGTLMVASSGLRTAHTCPFGKTVLHVSKDDGATWSPPRVIQNSMIDDRDAGIVNLGGGRVLVTWFRVDTRVYLPEYDLPAEERALWEQECNTWDDATVKQLVGSWVMLSEDGGDTWSEPIRAPVTSPHGPTLLRSGQLLYLGKSFGTPAELLNGYLRAARSEDGGITWQVCGQVPLYPNTISSNYHEPHVVELPSGKLIGAIRVEDDGGVNLERDAGVQGGMSIMMTESDDGGQTWSTPKPLNFHGGPPHLLRHSSGVLILTYGYRRPPYGQRVAFSFDDGATWQHDWVLRDDGVDEDLGYPSTVELADGALFTVYYQRAAAGEPCSLLWTRWQLP